MSNHHSNFILIPWQEDLLERLTDFVIEDAHGGFDNAIFIFPNSRPEKYLTRLIKQHPRLRRPTNVPRMESVGSLFSSLRSRIQSRPAWNAGLLDRVGLLLQCARDEEKHTGRVMGEKGVSFSCLQAAGQFFPRGVRLAGML